MLHSEQAKVQTVINLGKTLGQNNPECLGHWGRYSCLVSAGYFETALRIIIKNHIEKSKKTTPEIQRYVLQSIEAIQNPKAERFIAVLRLFSSNWGSNLEDYFLKNPDIKGAIDSLMSNRHLIAHGKTCGISVGTVETYFKTGNKAILYIEELLNA